VSDAIQKVAAAYDCKIVEGVLSHQLKQFVIDGNKAILSVSNPDTRVDDAEFEENEVYSIDIVTSTGEGKVTSDIFMACITYYTVQPVTLLGFSWMLEV
jgi:methionine aminopeptidase